MIGFVSGKVLGLEGSQVLIQTSSIGYLVHASPRVLETLSVGQEVEFFVHTNVRENAIELFGFLKAWEKRVFLLLISASGIGPKTAMGILNGLDPMDVVAALVREDKATLSSAPGIGKKTAERVIVELKGKAQDLMTELQVTGATSARPQSPRPPKLANVYDDAIATMLSLGYREVDAAKAVSTAAERLGADELVSLDRLVKASLQLMQVKRT